MPSVHATTALLMMRCRPGTAQSAGPSQRRACGGPGSAAHRFALPRSQITEALVNALALRRIRDTAAAHSAPLEQLVEAPLPLALLIGAHQNGDHFPLRESLDDPGRIRGH